MEVPAPKRRAQEQGGRVRLETIGAGLSWAAWAVPRWERPEHWPLHPQPAKQGVVGVPGEWAAASASAPGERLLP